jgi:predicted dienelactone hydrolase
MTRFPHIPFTTPISKASIHRWVALTVLGLAALFAQASTSAPVAAAEAVSVDPSLFTAQTFQWKDAERDRSVPAKLYLPAGPKLSAGTVPLVVFSHGIGGSAR